MTCPDCGHEFTDHEVWVEEPEDHEGSAKCRFCDCVTPWPPDERNADQLPMADWLKVEFYGLLPTTPATIDELDNHAIIEALAKAFGFTHIDQLTLTPARPPTWDTECAEFGCHDNDDN